MVEKGRMWRWEVWIDDMDFNDIDMVCLLGMLGFKARNEFWWFELPHTKVWALTKGSKKHCH